MSLLALEEKLHSQIPMTRLMKLSVKSLDETKLVTKAPLQININDKGTAFGGSLSTMTIISAWSLCYLIAKELNIEEANIVIFNNETKFLRPVTKDILCHTFRPSQEEIEELKAKIAQKGSGSIKLYSHIIEDEKVCVDFEGTYVIKAL